jgi:hypothetical protein
MRQCIFSVNIYSPRWGHEDSYQFILDENQMEITGGGGGKSAVCKWVESRDPIWKGYYDSTGNPFVNILENDLIHPPAIIISAIESAWTAWRNGELDNDELESEMNALADWLNTISKNKPNTDFWTKIF